MSRGAVKMSVSWTVLLAMAGCTQQLQPVAEPDVEVRSGAVPTAYVKAFPEADSRAACEKAIEARTAEGATRLDVHRFAGYATEIDEHGNRRVIQEFSVRNRAGSELPYRAHCVIKPDGTLAVTMAKTRAP